ncbi:MAG TPA: hypothetical protein VIV11_24550 [Kofleriaceae bacterium]
MQKLQLCAAALAVMACASDSDDLTSGRRKPRPPPSTLPDATEPPPPDPGGTISCYTQGAPSTTCTLPSHCCFTNYSAYHNGYCTTDSCGWGTITCDGPEDCSSGQQCCATKSDGGWSLACSNTACGAPPLGEELCQSSETCSGRSCVSAYDVNYDLPRTLNVCR